MRSVRYQKGFIEFSSLNLKKKRGEFALIVDL